MMPVRKPSTGGDPSERATAYNIQLSAVKTPGVTRSNHADQASADKASELLMLNHERYHTFFNEAGLHNHIVHHLLSLYALGATPDQIQHAYDRNKDYQLPAKFPPNPISRKLSSPAVFREYLGKSEYYQCYLKFFQNEIQGKGIDNTCNEYLFRGDQRANDMLGRLYSGFEHPILHLGFGLEFKQPCLVAEALAAAAIHDNWPLKLLLPAEELAKRVQPAFNNKTIISIIQAMKNDRVVSRAVEHEDPPNKLVSGVVKRALKEITPYLAQFTIKSPADLPRKTAEMQQACIFMSGAAQRPGKAVAFDFFLMHSTNLSVFFPTFMAQHWISDAAKIRLLEWKVRMDLAMYAGCRCPQLHPDRFRGYHPKHPGYWSSVFARACEYEDDGHTAKLVRALRAAEIASARYAGEPGFPMHRGDFLHIAHMVMDSVERMNEAGYRIPEQSKVHMQRLGMAEEVIKIVVRWTRWCGLPEAWEHVPDLKPGDEDGNTAKL